jgi:hypothetical protein
MAENEIYWVHLAEEHWRNARRRAIYEKVVCSIKGCPVELLPFEEVKNRLGLQQKLYRGLQDVPLKSIRGSVGRYKEFSATFLPRVPHLQERWQRVDQAVSEHGLPPIDLYQVGDAYFVLDGNHRVSIARQAEQTTIEAHVWEFPTHAGLSEQADWEELLLKTEQFHFLEETGLGDEMGEGAIELSCLGCYQDLRWQIENYRQGLVKAEGHEVSTRDAASEWYREVFLPAAKLIEENHLLDRFPNRTPADLFVWAWKHGETLENLVLHDSTLK